ncbi:hypothetical protein TGRUB_203250 [Toxoplasma gondii RUB]|uniref:Uncharacterized protein n=1 Tax=Toxoplasma gondii RUB TaxID=935652 RepID=A0A086LZ23_TOXGO|nr:hypothetical protein TGRUB_203250 [Toxoplasma gondii RUB]
MVSSRVCPECRPNRNCSNMANSQDIVMPGTNGVNLSALSAAVHNLLLLDPAQDAVPRNGVTSVPSVVNADGVAVLKSCGGIQPSDRKPTEQSSQLSSEFFAANEESASHRSFPASVDETIIPEGTGTVAVLQQMAGGLSLLAFPSRSGEVPRHLPQETGVTLSAEASPDRNRPDEDGSSDRNGLTAKSVSKYLSGPSQGEERTRSTSKQRKTPGTKAVSALRDHPKSSSAGARPSSKNDIRVRAAKKRDRGHRKPGDQRIERRGERGVLHQTTKPGTRRKAEEPTPKKLRRSSAGSAVRGEAGDGSAGCKHSQQSHQIGGIAATTVRRRDLTATTPVSKPGCPSPGVANEEACERTNQRTHQTGPNGENHWIRGVDATDVADSAAPAVLSLDEIAFSSSDEDAASNSEPETKATRRKSKLAKQSKKSKAPKPLASVANPDGHAPLPSGIHALPGDSPSDAAALRGDTKQAPGGEGSTRTTHTGEIAAPNVIRRRRSARLHEQEAWEQPLQTPESFPTPPTTSCETAVPAFRAKSKALIQTGKEQRLDTDMRGMEAGGLAGHAPRQTVRRERDTQGKDTTNAAVNQTDNFGGLTHSGNEIPGNCGRFTETRECASGATGDSALLHNHLIRPVQVFAGLPRNPAPFSSCSRKAGDVSHSVMPVGTDADMICVRPPILGSELAVVVPMCSRSPATPELTHRSSCSASYARLCLDKDRMFQPGSQPVESCVSTALNGVVAESSESRFVPYCTRFLGVPVDRVGQGAAEERKRKIRNRSSLPSSSSPQLSRLSRTPTRLRNPANPSGAASLVQTRLVDHEVELLRLRLRHARERRCLKRRICQVQLGHKEALEQLERDFRSEMYKLERRQMLQEERHDSELRKLEERHMKRDVDRVVKLLGQLRQRISARKSTTPETQPRKLSNATGRPPATKTEMET